MKSNEFKCARCEGVFEKGWSDEEAAAELGERFPGFTEDECVLICDDCFQAGEKAFQELMAGFRKACAQ